jgi:hypothetical protein
VTNLDPPEAENLALIGRGVLVEDYHAGVGTSRYSSAWSWNA